MTKGTTAVSQAKSANKKEGFIKVTQIKSRIGTKPLHRGTLEALGLRRIGRINYFVNSKEVTGMISRVSHLVSVDYLDKEQLAKEDHKKVAKFLAPTTKTGESKK